MIITIHHYGASPGATTLATLLAAHWPDAKPRLVIEADPGGGVLASRWHRTHDLRNEPGIVALAAANTIDTPDGLAAVTQPIAEQIRVSPGAQRSRTVAAALGACMDRHGRHLVHDPNLIALVDLGRIDEPSPAAHQFLEAAHTRITVTGNRLEDLCRLTTGLEQTSSTPPTVLVVRERPDGYPAAGIADRLNLTLAGVLPDDPGAARQWDRDGLHATGRFQRSALVEAAAAIASSVASACGTPVVDEPVNRRSRMGEWSWMS